MTCTIYILAPIMPMIGWICVYTIIQYFKVFESFIPWIALILLLFVGGKMLWEGIKSKNKEIEKPEVGLTALFVQGVATSIDALSVGFTIAEYSLSMAIVCVVIIAIVTFVICITGLIIGKKFGTKFSNRATIFGGVILIVIGLEIFITGVL
ncbi:MAG: manganese efflux pump [Anaerostipes faecalis]|nr:manganese efflux pump [Anaerostipes faecalis]